MQRERKSAQGMMLQTTLHHTIGWKAALGRWSYSARSTTGKVVYARFRPSEDQLGYLLMLRTVALHFGLPHILYHDRHTILRSPNKRP